MTIMKVNYTILQNTMSGKIVTKLINVLQLEKPNRLYEVKIIDLGLMERIIWVLYEMEEIIDRDWWKALVLFPSIKL